MTCVIVSAKARDDFRKVASYLSRHAGSVVAKRYAEEFDACLTLIAEHPRIGAERPELGTNVRTRVIRPYILIYGFAGETVEVLRIVHGRRKLTKRKLLG